MQQTVLDVLLVNTKHFEITEIFAFEMQRLYSESFKFKSFLYSNKVKTCSEGKRKKNSD